MPTPMTNPVIIAISLREYFDDTVAIDDGCVGAIIGTRFAGRSDRNQLGQHRDNHCELIPREKYEFCGRLPTGSCSSSSILYIGIEYDIYNSTIIHLAILLYAIMPLPRSSTHYTHPRSTIFI